MGSACCEVYRQALVEDHASFRNAMALLLEREGIKVIGQAGTLVGPPSAKQRHTRSGGGPWPARGNREGFLLTRGHQRGPHPSLPSVTSTIYLQNEGFLVV